MDRVIILDILKQINHTPGYAFELGNTHLSNVSSRVSNRIEYIESNHVFCIGDIHGDWVTLQYNMFYILRHMTPESYIVFHGDIVDRGPEQMRCLALVFWLKSQYPNQVWFICGNHEEEAVNARYPEGFAYNLMNCGNEVWTHVLHQTVSYDKRNAEHFIQVNNYFRTLWRNCNAYFKQLPAMIILNHQICLTHGGIPVRFPSSHFPLDKFASDTKLETLATLSYNDPLIRQCAWNDFGPETKVSSRSDGMPDDGMARVVSLLDTKTWLDDNGLKCIIRGHQYPDEYEVPELTQDGLIYTIHTTIFMSEYNLDSTIIIINDTGIERMKAKYDDLSTVTEAKLVYVRNDEPEYKYT